MHFPPKFLRFLQKKSPPIFFMVHLLHRLYGVDAPELTCCNSLSASRLACSRLSAHIQVSVNNPRRQTRPIHGHELS